MFFQPPNSLAMRWLGADWKSLEVFELQEEPSVKTRKTSQQLDRAVSKPGRSVACAGLGPSPSLASSFLRQGHSHSQSFIPCPLPEHSPRLT